MSRFVQFFRSSEYEKWRLGRRAAYTMVQVCVGSQVFYHNWNNARFMAELECKQDKLAWDERNRFRGIDKDSLERTLKADAVVKGILYYLGGVYSLATIVFDERERPNWANPGSLLCRMPWFINAHRFTPTDCLALPTGPSPPTLQPPTNGPISEGHIVPSIVPYRRYRVPSPPISIRWST